MRSNFASVCFNAMASQGVPERLDRRELRLLELFGPRHVAVGKNPSRTPDRKFRDASGCAQNGFCPLSEKGRPVPREKSRGTGTSRGNAIP